MEYAFLIGGLLAGWIGGRWANDRKEKSLKREIEMLNMRVSVLDQENTQLARRLKRASEKIS